ncbi:hypothetical protein [Rickettsia endosymbiont of Polydrusus tereticollis]
MTYSTFFEPRNNALKVGIRMVFWIVFSIHNKKGALFKAPFISFG